MNDFILRAVLRLSVGIVVGIAVVFALLVRGHGTRSQIEDDPLALQRDKSGNWHPIYREGLWGYVDNEGRVVVKPRFNWASDFSEGRAAVAIWKTEQCGFIRPDGSWAKLLPRGAVIGWPFSEGRAWYREGQLFGCIDADGNVRIPPRYDDAQQFSEGLRARRQMRSTGTQTETQWGFRLAVRVRRPIGP